jgi:hypothetical protein
MVAAMHYQFSGQAAATEHEAEGFMQPFLRLLPLFKNGPTACMLEINSDKQNILHLFTFQGHGRLPRQT